MSLGQALYQMMQDNQAAGHPTDLRVGTVTKESPLEITINTQSAPLKGPVLILTEPVVEKKIPVLEHLHSTPVGPTHCTEHWARMACRSSRSSKVTALFVRFSR